MTFHHDGPRRGWPRLFVLLSAAAGLRAFAVGLTGVLLGLHLARLGLGPSRTGLVIAAGLAGNAVASAALAWLGAGWDRRTTLVVTAALSGAGLAAVALFAAPEWLMPAAFVGMVNGMGRDRGPAQVVEQSILADRMPAGAGTRVMVRYAAAQDVLGGLGSLAAALPDLIPGDPVATTRVVLLAAGALLLGSVALYLPAVPAGSPPATAKPATGVAPDSDTRRRLRSLAALFALDSLGGGFLAGSILSYWFFKRFGLAGDVVGPLFLLARGLNAASYFGAELLARRIGLIRTMVFTHLPSSLFLLLLPWAPTPLVAAVLFLAREALVQMDVPARQAYVAAVTRPGERVYAFALTGLARSVGWAVGPGLAGWSAQALGLGAPLVLGAGLKIGYDLLLYRRAGSADLSAE